MNARTAFAEIESDPLTDVDSISDWLAGHCAQVKLPGFIFPRRTDSALDDCDVPMLLALALDPGQPDAIRVRAMNRLGDNFLTK